MKRYEYKMVKYLDDTDDAEAKLTELGLDGWRIRNAVTSPNPAYLHCGIVFMEREITDLEPANEQKAA